MMSLLDFKDKSLTNTNGKLGLRQNKYFNFIFVLVQYYYLKLYFCYL